MAVRTKVTINGSMGTSERWSTGFTLGFGDVLDNQECALLAEDIGQAIAATTSNPLGSLLNLISSVGSITDVSVYSYGASGPAVAGATYTLPSAKFGSGTPQCPPQTAVVYTLLTDSPGASRRGRMYWPAVNPTMSNSFKSSAAAAGRNDMAIFLATVEALAAPFGSFLVSVYSPKLDELTVVSRVRSDDVLDTQRRRRDTLIPVTGSAQIIR